MNDTADPMMSQFMERLSCALSYTPDAATDPARLVVSSASARWLGPETTHNPSRIGVLPEIPARSIEIFLQEIPGGEASDMQRHAHESIHYVMEGEGYSEIGPAAPQWRAGDFVYTPPWVWHRHYNAGTGVVRMLLIENSRLLDSVGVAERQSAGLIDYATLLATTRETAASWDLLT